MTSPHGKGVREQVRRFIRHPSVMLLATLVTSVGIFDGAPSTAHSSCYIYIMIYINCALVKLQVST